MTTPPLVDVNTIRVRLDYTNSNGEKAGSRFFLSYTGSAPTGANCTTLASDIAAAWATHITEDVHSSWALTEVDVLDIASPTGLSGTWTGSNAGGDSSLTITANTAMNVEFNIARRYRGGKPRMFWPPPGVDQLATSTSYKTTFVSQMATDVGAFFAEIVALSIGAVGTLVHINVSYYQGFTNHANTSGRERAVPTYRTTATHDNITGYAPKAIVGSQRRRRTSTTY